MATATILVAFPNGRPPAPVPERGVTMGRGIRRIGFGALVAVLATGCTEEDWAAFFDVDVYFVKLETQPAQTVGVALDLADELGLEPIHVYDGVTQGFSVRMSPWLAAEVEGIREVAYVQRDEPRQRIPDRGEPELGENELPESIARIGGPYLGGVSFDGCHVAVVDSGIDAHHPDLVVAGEHDVVARSGGPAAPGADPNGHGTHVAGTIGAQANGFGVVGVAPGVPLHAVRVIGPSGFAYTTDIVAGLEYVLRSPEICVVNLSLGSAGNPHASRDILRDGIERLEAEGVVVVVAAGNAASDTSGYTPAGYEAGLAVSAYDASGGWDRGFATFSNYGAAVAVSAPGVDVRSTWPGGGYASISGTSMAAPAVAGAAAVYRALRPSASVNEVRSVLISTGENGYAGQSGRHPEPMVDVAALVRAGGG